MQRKAELWRVEVYLGPHETACVKAPYQLRDICKSLPGRQWNARRKTWDVPLRNLPDVVNTFSRVHSCRIVLDKQTAEYYEYMIERDQTAARLHEQEAAKDINLGLIRPEMAKRLYSYQPLAAEFLVTCENGILAMDMGTGKSVSSLIAATHLFLEQAEIEEPWLKGCIVVAPKTLVLNWYKEILKWTGLGAVIVEGSPKQRQERYAEFLTGDKPFLILNYELCRYDYDVLRQLILPIVPDCIVIADEAHRLKNRKTSTVRHFKGYSGRGEGRTVGIFANAAFRWALTGTPLENTVEEVWSLADWVRPGVFGTLNQFKDMYTIRDAFGDIIGLSNTPELRNILAPMMFRKTKEEALKDLPPLVIMPPVLVKMTKAQKAVYDAVASGVLTYEDEGGKEVNEYLELLAQLTRLQQVCNYPALLPGCDVTESAKLEELLNILQDFTGEYGQLTKKVLIFSQYKKMCDVLMEKLAAYKPLYIHGDVPTAHSRRRLAEIRKRRAEKGLDAGDDIQHDWQTTEELGHPLIRLEIANKFNESEDHNLIIVDTAAKEGLDIYFEYGIMYDELFNPQAMNQIYGRGHRLGATVDTVFIINLVTEHSYEERKQEILERKRELFSAVIDGKEMDDRLVLSSLTKEDLEFMVTGR